MKQERAQPRRILIIDDNLAIHDDFRKILVKSRSAGDALGAMESALFGDAPKQIEPTLFELDFATQGEEGLALARQACDVGRPHALAFVDGRMPPGLDGIETIGRLWQSCPELQVVLCTAYADYSWEEIRDLLGETDSLVILKKPFDNVEVLQLAHALTQKYELNREVQGRLHQLAYYDGLTGLPNRVLFIDRLNQILKTAQRTNHRSALLFIDLDNFKRINDTLGHSMGDALLQITAERLIHCLRDTDTAARPGTDALAARLGGDEFTVVLPMLDKEENAAIVAKRIVEQLSEPLDLGNHQVIATPSIGIAIFPEDGNDVSSLLKNADLAMYFAKSAGPGTFKYYQESMNALALQRLTLEHHLRQAILREELSLDYQPQFELESGQISGMEVLLRWHNEKLGKVPPIEFISIAEETGLIIAIGEWVLRQACMQAWIWLAQGLEFRRIAVNVSVKQCTHPGFLDMFRSVLAETRLPPERLEIEITESLLAQDPRSVAAILNAIKALGVSIAVDDFGTGYSSLSRLREMPIDVLKIDRSFVCGLEENGSDQSIICAIIAMAEAMSLAVIAEGVETPGQVAFLCDKACDQVQGYLYSRPMNSQQSTLFLQRQALSVARRCAVNPSRDTAV